MADFYYDWSTEISNIRRLTGMSKSDALNILKVEMDKLVYLVNDQFESGSSYSSVSVVNCAYR